MARMIPSHIERDDPRRTGEYMVYDWLAKESIPGVAFYSHKQNNHEHKTMSEADFLYICSNGLLCIEVKGGQVKKQETQWISIDRNNVEHKISDPFWQSHGCMKAATSYLEDTYGKKSVESLFCVGSAVIFPQCIAECEGDSVIREVMFDSRNELSEFPSFLSNSIKYWADELYRKQSKRTVQLSPEQIEQVVTLFEGDFCSVPSMKLLIDSSYSEMLKLTDEQVDVLYSIDENKRVMVYGAAGTGKSVLAVKKLRTDMTKKKKVAYLCFNRNMASYVEQNVKVVKGSYIGTFHALLGKYITDSHEMTVEQLSQAYLAKEIVPNESFDLVIVDEAQDILSKNSLKCLDSFIKKGLTGGEWILFADPNQDIFQKGERFEEAERFLKDTYNPCILRLYINCRNTAQIARRTSMLTNIPPSKYMKLTGPEVKTFEFEDDAEAIQLIDKEIRSILAGGTYVKDIIILSTRTLEKSILGGVGKLADVDLVEVRSFKGIKQNQINYMTVQSFKGLESKIVFYIDIDGFDSVDNRRMNYVAMSRAQILLYYFFNRSLKAEYDKRMVDGVEILG